MSDLDGKQQGDVGSVLSTLIEIIRPYAKGDDPKLNADTQIDKLGIDSFDFVEIIFKLEETYSIDVDYNVNSTYKSTVTIGQLAGEVAAQVAAKSAPKPSA